LQQTKRFEVLFADLEAALGPTYAKHSTADGQFRSPYGKAYGSREFQIRAPPSRPQSAETTCCLGCVLRLDCGLDLG
jgi:hypothetical protein